MNIAIIGAGMAGLAAARRLHEIRPDLTCTIWEKSRGVGGRAATRRIEGAAFDHGAQYIKAPTPELAIWLHEFAEPPVDIARPVWTFDRTGTITAGDPAQNSDPKWTYPDGITRLARQMAADRDIRFSTRIAKFVQRGEQYDVWDDRGEFVQTADALLITTPAPQGHALVAASMIDENVQASLLHELGQVRFRPCLTITLKYAPVLRPRPWYALVNTDRAHPISWLAYEHVKPGRATDQHVVIAQMAPQWSQAHWDDETPAVAAQVARLLSDVLHEALPVPQWWDRQGWRYALPDNGADFDRLNDTATGLFFAGDWTAGQGRVHLAIEQGWRVAERIAAWAERRAS